MKKNILDIQLALAFLLAVGIPAYAQEGGRLDTTFFAIDRDAGSGFNSSVRDIAFQSDGKTVAAGRFTSFNGKLAPGLIRLNKNGTKDYSFNVESGFKSVSDYPDAFSLIILPDDRILIGGEFTHYNGSPAPNIVRLNSDGTIDPSFDIGSGFNNRVQSIALQPDGKILVGGMFTSYRSEPAPYLIRLNSDGSKDATFNVGTVIESQVYTLGLQPDDKVLVHAGNEVIRLDSDGSFDPSFNLSSPFGDEYIHEDYGPQINKVNVNSIKVLENGKILLAGSLHTSLKSLIPLVRLNSDGSRDLEFTTYEYEIGNGGYNEIILMPEGKIFSIGMISRDQAGVLRFNSDGTMDASFDTDNGSTGFAVALQPDGKLIAGMYSNGNENIIRYQEDGSLDLTYNPIPEFDARVTAIGIQTDGKTIVGGDFNVYNGQLAQGIVRINPDGTVDQSFNSGTGLDGHGDQIIPQNDGKILIRGNISIYNGAAVSKIFRLNQDGTLDNSFNSGVLFDYPFSLTDIALQEDGKILVAGYLSDYLEDSIGKIFRLNPDGTMDPTFNTGIDFDMRILTIHPIPDGKILIGGSTDGNPGEALVRLNSDGSKDLSFNIGFDININLLSIVVQHDGKILAAGSAGINDPDPRLMRFNPDGTLDPSFNAEIQSQSINSLILLSNGSILVRTDSEDNEKALIRLNSNGSIDPTFHIGDRRVKGRAINALAIQPDGNIVVGGEFTFFNGIVANRIARLLNPIETLESVTEVVRINSGGDDIVLDGVQWHADQYYSGGRIYTRNNPIDNTENDPLYQSERNGNFTYEIPVPEQGLYTAELHFAEIHWQKSGARLFRIAVEGDQPGSIIDLYEDHGGANSAFVLKMDDIEVVDGHLTIALITEKDNAKISGIAVFEQSPSTKPEKLRINSGGGALDFGKEKWLDDRYFTGGHTYSIKSGKITNTHRDELYRSERFGNFSYRLPAPEVGLYTIEFHLAEIYWEFPASRIFDITVENGQFELEDIDVYGDYDGSRSATVIIAENIKVTDGFLDVGVSKTKDNGKISGIVMYKQSVDPHPSFITRINSGGEALQIGGENWQADQYYSGGRTYSNDSKEIANSDKDELFYTERYGDFSYGIPVPASGLYTVELHFAEIHWNREGARIFDVAVENGQYALEDLDLYRELGDSYLSTVYVGKDINVADGILNIEFSKVKDNPKVSGIVVYEQSTSGARLQTMDPVSQKAESGESSKFSKGLGSGIKLYPNPANDRIRLELFAEETGDWEFVLVNSSGTTTHLAQLNLEIGEYLLEFDLSQYSLSAGTYYVQIRNNKGVFKTKRVIIL